MEHHSCEVSRRHMLQAGTAIAASAGLGSVPAFAAEKRNGAKPALPTRELGQRTGTQVSILNQGTSMRLSNRLFNTTWAEGIRYLDLAEMYENGTCESFAAQWLEKTGRRKDIFIVTKDNPKSADHWVEQVDQRLAAIKIDQLDLFFIHGLGGGGKTTTGTPDMPKAQEWAKAAEKMKKAGKIKFAGFSTHCEIGLRTTLLNNASEGWADVIMVAANPTLVRENKEFNKSIDKCYEAGIGLVAMKEMRGLDGINNVIPEFEALGMTKYAAVLSAVWSDERFASICSSMRNVKQIRENAAVARDFKPLPKDKISLITDVIQREMKSFCVGCDERCAHAAGKKVAFADIARYLNYFEADGDRETARKLFQALPAEVRDWKGADLRAAADACVTKLPMEEILRRAEHKLA